MLVHSATPITAVPVMIHPPQRTPDSRGVGVLLYRGRPVMIARHMIAMKPDDKWCVMVHMAAAMHPVVVHRTTAPRWGADTVWMHARITKKASGRASDSY